MNKTLFPQDFSFRDAFPTLTRKLRLGIVGGGRIAATQAMAAEMSGYWKIVAGALSSDPAQAIERGKKWSLPEERCYKNFEVMAHSESQRQDGIDAVMITTPNHLHYDAAKAFLNAGIEVLCDKPLTNAAVEAYELATLTKKKQRVFGVCYVMSCFPMVRQAKEMIKRNAIGKINQIHVEFMQDWMVPDSASEAAHVKWRLDPKISGPTSCTGDIGTHAHHLATHVSGLNMTELQARMHVCGAPKKLEDTVIMTTTYTGGVPGTLMATRLACGNRGGLRLRIFGSKGGLEWDLEKPEQLKYNRYEQPDQVLSRGHGHGIYPNVERFVRLARGFSEGMIEAWSNLYIEFAMAVAVNKDGIDTPKNYLNLPTVEQGAQGVTFIEAVVQSHQQGKEVSLHSPDEARQELS